jgi:O-antigen/teichoic acid export membrane protein
VATSDGTDDADALMNRGEQSVAAGSAVPDAQDRLPTFIRGAGFNLGGRVVGQASQLLAHVALARFYGPAAFGLFALGWTVYRLGSFLAALGLESGMMRYGSISLARDRGEVRAVAGRTLGMGTLAGALFGVALFFLAPAMATVFGEPGLKPLMRIFAVGLPLAAAMRVGVAATRVSQKMTYSVLSEYMLQPVTFLALVVLTYLLGQGVTGGAAAAVVSYGLAASVAVYFTFRLFPRSDSPQSHAVVSRRELVAFSLPAALAGVFGIAILWADRLFLGYFMATEAVGVYQAASQSALIFTVVPTATGTILAPLIVELHSRRQLLELSRLFSFSIRWGLILAAPAFFVVFSVPGDFLHFLFGIEYAAGATALRILTAGQVISLATGTAGFALVMVGRQKQWLIISAGALAANIVLNWLFIPRFGITGAALATAIATSLLYLTPLFMLRRLIGLNVFEGGTVRLLAPASIAVLALILVNAVHDGSPIIALLLNGAIGGSLFFGGTLLYAVKLDEPKLFRHLVRSAGKSQPAKGHRKQMKW